jgi:multimeric flavodoxin WrbA
LYEELGATVDCIRAVDHEIATGVYPDMTTVNSKWKVDEWPKLYERIMEADVLILATPIWFVFERLMFVGWG